MPEHVHRRGDAAEQRLSEPERRAEPHRVAIEDGALGLPDRPEPGFERQVLDEAAEEAVAGVAVGVNEARCQQHAAGVDDPACLGLRIDGRAQPGDAAGLDRDRAVADHGAGGVAGHDQRVRDEEIGRHRRLPGFPPTAGAQGLDQDGMAIEALH